MLRSLFGAGAASRALRAGVQSAWSRGYAEEPLKNTVLKTMHEEMGAKFGPFAGYDMPLFYPNGGVVGETKHCREKAVLFDVSHMCAMRIKGKDAIAFWEKVVVADVAELEDGTGKLSLITNENGGIIDDTVVTKVSDNDLYVVVNAGCRDKDLAHINGLLSTFKASGPKDVGIHVYDERALLAFQGPQAVAALQSLVRIDLDKLYFGMFTETDIKGIDTFIQRTGYTGEDGVELCVPKTHAAKITEMLLAAGDVKMAGLGARDTLRLEAGLCLYGNDLDETTTPAEAGLTWTIGARRRVEGGFTGSEKVMAQVNKQSPITRRRVGIVCPSGAPPRGHMKIFDSTGTTEIGETTSGCPSPTLGKNLAMGYVSSSSFKSGTPVKIQVRKSLVDGVITKMPFVDCHYHRPT